MYCLLLWGKYFLFKTSQGIWRKIVAAATVFKGGYYYKGDDIHIRIIT